MNAVTILALLAVSANAISLEKRSACSDQYGSESHSACLNPPTRDQEGISEADKKVIVDKHNELRGNVEKYNNQPTATNMQKMVWDEEVAMIAQKWASNCQYGHDSGSNRAIPGKYSVGQNAARGSSWTGVVMMWFNEVENFQYGVTTSGVGHYTQVAWAVSAKLGCGYAMCSDGSFYVCNYASAGNYNPANKPYISGEKGSACSNNYNQQTGLCDCNGMVCHRGTKLNVDTCRCDCIIYGKYYDVLQNDEDGQCVLKCENAQDKRYCGEGLSFSPERCTQWVNVPYACPLMCNTCPS